MVNWTAPPSSFPLGAMKLSVAGNFFSSIAQEKEELQEKKLGAYAGLLKEAGNKKDKNTINIIWTNIPYKLKQHHYLVRVYVTERLKFDAAADPEVTTVLATVPVPDAALTASIISWSILLPIALDTTCTNSDLSSKFTLAWWKMSEYSAALKSLIVAVTCE